MLASKTSFQPAVAGKNVMTNFQVLNSSPCRQGCLHACVPACRRSTLVQGAQQQQRRQQQRRQQQRRQQLQRQQQQQQQQQGLM
jgi:hypothetical protein